LKSVASGVAWVKLKVGPAGGGSRNFVLGGTWREREREPITGVWEQSAQWGARGQSPRWRVRRRSAPEAEGFGRPTDGTNLHLLQYFQYIAGLNNIYYTIMLLLSTQSVR